MQKINKDNVAIIVSSPFQAICAIEAIKKFDLYSCSFYLPGNDRSIQMTMDFLEHRGYMYVNIENTTSALRLIKKNNNYKKFDTVLVGDYFAANHFILSLLWTKRNSTIIYVDDGNSTLSLLPPFSRKRFNEGSNIRRLFYRLLLLYYKFRGLRNLFFSCFDIRPSDFPMQLVHNSFDTLKHHSIKNVSKGVYIIGTNTSQIGWDRSLYSNYLQTIASYVRSRYVNEEIFYCPHRYDNNLWEEDCTRLGIKMFYTKISVEVDFIQSGIEPLCVIGFGSTALVTLHYIYPKAQITDIVFHSHDKVIEDEYREIENRYSEYGIDVVEISDLTE